MILHSPRAVSTYLFAFAATLLTVATLAQKPIAPELDKSFQAITPQAIQGHMEFLASDMLEGRQPGTRGYELAALYVESQFKILGLQPAGEKGTFRQRVPMVRGVTQGEGCSFTIQRKEDDIKLDYGNDFILSPDFLAREETLSAPVIFVGYGITAPEFGYDDYAKADVKGKVVLIVNGSPTSFPSNPRAYYSGNAVKYQNAAAHGAVGVISFNPATAVRSSWEASVRRSKQGIFRWADSRGMGNGTIESIKIMAGISEETAEKFFEKSGKKFSDVMAATQNGKARYVDLKTTVQIRGATKLTTLESPNIVGMLEGSNPALKNEYLVYVAHVDHFGIGAPVKQDSIYNGAHDNASGVSILLEIARAFKALPKPPDRSILFLVVTGEEYGLQGSDYFINNPTVPGEAVVANLSLDMPFLFHPLLDVVPYGSAHSSLGEEVKKAAALLKLGVSPDPIPEQVLFIRSDHFSFIKKGIPALFIKCGFETGNASLDGRTVNLDWRKNIYHTPQDDMQQAFYFEAGADHARLNFLIGYFVATNPLRPTWNTGDFFGTKFGGQK